MAEAEQTLCNLLSSFLWALIFAKWSCFVLLAGYMCLVSLIWKLIGLYLFCLSQSEALHLWFCWIAWIFLNTRLMRALIDDHYLFTCSRTQADFDCFVFINEQFGYNYIIKPFTVLKKKKKCICALGPSFGCLCSSSMVLSVGMLHIIRTLPLMKQSSSVTQPLEADRWVLPTLLQRRIWLQNGDQTTVLITFSHLLLFHHVPKFREIVLEMWIGSLTDKAGFCLI